MARRALPRCLVAATAPREPRQTAILLAAHVRADPHQILDRRRHVLLLGRRGLLAPPVETQHGTSFNVRATKLEGGPRSLPRPHGRGGNSIGYHSLDPLEADHQYLMVLPTVTESTVERMNLGVARQWV